MPTNVKCPNCIGASGGGCCISNTNKIGPNDLDNLWELSNINAKFTSERGADSETKNTGWIIKNTIENFIYMLSQKHEITDEDPIIQKYIISKI